MTEEIEHEKHEWARGEWDHEPDKEQFYYREVPCLIVRNSLGALCGYAGVYPGHPWFKVDYDEICVEVHGGLTYSDKCAGVICHVPKPDEPPVWWLGFDTAHSGDRIPGLKEYDGDWYKNIDYVRAECRNLADQIIEADK